MSKKEEIDKKERAELTDKIVGTRWFQLYFKPYIENEVKKNESIKTLDIKDIEKSYIKQKVRYDVYSGILYKIEEWIKIGGKQYARRT